MKTERRTITLNKEHCLFLEWVKATDSYNNPSISRIIREIISEKMLVLEKRYGFKPWEEFPQKVYFPNELDK